MLNLLGNIIEVILNIPSYILFAIESIINVFFAGVQGLFGVVGIIALPGEPAVPEFIEELNWFFPVGSVITIMSPIVVGYVAFLLVRWIFKWAGEL